jgi:hypothetical protein
MSADPISRLEVARNEVDRVFGRGYAATHPDVVAAVLTCATIDQAARVIATALLVEDAAMPAPIVRPHALVRP